MIAATQEALVQTIDVGNEERPAALEAATFEPFVGKPVGFSGSTPVFTLDRVERLALQSSVPRAPFTLIFSAPRDIGILPEGLHRCALAGGPSVEIYVVPIHTVSADRQDYQAVFN